MSLLLLQPAAAGAMYHGCLSYRSQSYLESWRQDAQTIQSQLQRDAGRGNTGKEIGGLIPLW